MTLLLDRQTIQGLLDMEKMIEILKQAFGELVPSPDENDRFHIVTRHSRESGNPGVGMAPSMAKPSGLGTSFGISGDATENRGSG